MNVLEKIRNLEIIRKMLNFEDFKKIIDTGQYDFLRDNQRLGKRIILLGLGGSYAYGTNNEDSDIDFRGITLNLPSDLIGLTKKQSYGIGSMM